MKNLLKMSDLSPAELTHILDVADQLKADCKAGRTAPLLAGKSVALLFSKASTRTRTSFEVGVYQMGGLGNYMNTAELQAGRGEPLRDTARVLGRYYDCAVWRTYRQRDLEELAELSGIPVINGLTDYAHPCQVLADLMTIRERRGTLAGLKLCFVGDGSNMANSLIVGGLLAGMQVSCVCPPGYRPAADVLIFAHKYGNAFHLTTDPAEGVRDADIVATAAWNTTAPGTAESEQRLRDFVGFQLTGRLLENAKPDALVLHCLPAHRGEEISTALFEQHADEIFDEAENRLHVQKAVLAVLLAVSVIGNVLLALWNSGAFDGKEQPATPVMERSLEGYYLPAIEDELEQMSGYNFIYRYEYSDTYPSGVIYKQSLAVGQVLPEDGSVTLYISKGPQYTVMPDLYGANEAYAIRILTDCQISYTIVYDTNPETGGEPGTVVGTSIAPGSPVGPRTAAEVDTVTVTIKGASEEPFYG